MLLFPIVEYEQQVDRKYAVPYQAMSLLVLNVSVILGTAVEMTKSWLAELFGESTK